VEIFRSARLILEDIVEDLEMERRISSGVI
jgi:hypothetical protein